MSRKDWNHRRQRPVRHGRADRSRREDADDAVRRSVGSVRAGDAARQARGVPGAARQGPSPHPDRAELPRQHLRHEAARRRVDHVGQRGRQPAGEVRADGSGVSRISSSIARAAASARSSATASSRTSASRIRCRITSRRWRRTARPRPAPRRIAAAPTSAWKARSSRRWPNRTCIARGAATSSA